MEIAIDVAVNRICSVYPGLVRAQTPQERMALAKEQNISYYDVLRKEGIVLLPLSLVLG